jgi:hypothetical protein
VESEEQPLRHAVYLCYDHYSYFIRVPIMMHDHAVEGEQEASYKVMSMACPI